MSKAMKGLNIGTLAQDSLARYHWIKRPDHESMHNIVVSRNLWKKSSILKLEQNPSHSTIHYHQTQPKRNRDQLSIEERRNTLAWRRRGVLTAIRWNISPKKTLSIWTEHQPGAVLRQLLHQQIRRSKILMRNQRIWSDYEWYWSCCVKVENGGKHGVSLRPCIYAIVCFFGRPAFQRN